MPLGAKTVEYDLASSPRWQDAAGTTPASADLAPVGRLDDVSGNARHATQATSGARPTYRATGSGGLPLVRADGTSQWMSIPTAAFPSGPITIHAAVVLRGIPSEAGAGRLIHCEAGSTSPAPHNTSIGIHRRSDAVASGYGWLFAGGGVGTLGAGTSVGRGYPSHPILPDQRTLIELVLGAESWGVRKVDSHLANDPESVSYGVNTQAGDRAALFARVNASLSAVNFGRWDLCHLIIHQGEPTPSESADLRDELMGRWAIAGRPTRSYSGWATEALDALIASAETVGDPSVPMASSHLARAPIIKLDARPPLAPGLRDWDRSMGGDGTSASGFGGASPALRLGSNIQTDAALIRLCYKLGGDYASFADAWIAYATNHAKTVSPRGLIAGGDHSAHAKESLGTTHGLTGQPTAGEHLVYETSNEDPTLRPLYAANDPVALVGHAAGLWEHSITVKSSPGALNAGRHVRMVSGTTSSDGAFGRYLAEYVAYFAEAYLVDSESHWLTRSELLVDHLLLEGTVPGTSPNLVRLHATTRLISFAHDTTVNYGAPRNQICAIHHGYLMAESLDDALATGAFDAAPSLKAKVETLRDICDDQVIGAANDLGPGGEGLAVVCRWDDPSDVPLRTIPWGSYYGRPHEGSRAYEIGRRGLQLRARGDTTRADACLAIARASADHYLTLGLPAEGEGALPQDYAGTLNLMLLLHQEDGGSAYLDFAEAVAGRSIERLTDADSPLFRYTEDLGFYESKSGAPKLMEALYELQEVLDTPPPRRRRRGRGRPSPWGFRGERR